MTTADPPEPPWIARAIRAIVGLGVLLRVARYAMDFPLWWDESFVAANLLRRGYLDLLKPLDFGQVCPPGFLWVELAAVRALGFSTWTLRLFPLACGVASVFLFRFAAGRVVRGVPLLFAVAIFAASFHPIRHAADVKPYASDLLAALVLLTPALCWWRDTSRVGWLWVLAAAIPPALAASHPAVFVAGGVSLTVAPAAWRSGRLGAKAAAASAMAATAATFAALFVLVTGPQARATLPAMGADWAGSFPPIGSPAALAAWLARVHAGSMMAYPVGGEGGASAATLLLCLIGAAAWARSGRAIPLAACLAPMGLAFVAAALRRYPYGGSANGASARIMQYAAPAICLLAGAGAAQVLKWLAGRGRAGAGAGGPHSRKGARLTVAVLLALAAAGIVPVASDLSHPWRSVHSEMSRAFARGFWPEVSRDAEVVDLRWDLDVAPWDTIRLGVPVALCNEAIYCESRRGPRSGPSTPAPRLVRGVLCVAMPEDEPRLDAWLARVATTHTLARRTDRLANMAEPGATPRPERYVILDLVPRPGFEGRRGLASRY